MARPQSRLGVRNGAQSYGLYPMNINGTMLMSEAMPKGNNPYVRVEDQIPTADTRRLELGLKTSRVSDDVGRYERAHAGRFTPEPGTKSNEQFDLDVAGINTGRPSVWSPPEDSDDDLQRKVDSVQRRIYELNQDVLPPRGIGTESKNAFLGNPAYNNKAGSDGQPFVRTIGTPQPDPLKYVWNAKQAGEFDYSAASGKSKR
jgi:hypothetical protein